MLKLVVKYYAMQYCRNIMQSCIPIDQVPFCKKRFSRGKVGENTT